jgi:transcriptional regulator with XRE-family HTH domain
LTLGQKMRAIRKAVGLSQEEVARRSHMTLTAVSRLERGVATDPHLSTLRAVSGALGVPMTMLLNDADATVEVSSDVPLAV